MHISAAGIPMIFLNDFKAYNDLLHNRGDIYSDKPRMVMTGELCGAEYMVRFGPPSPINLFFFFPSVDRRSNSARTHRSRSRVRETE